MQDTPLKDPTSPKTVVVTGGTGFLGSHIVDSLLAAGHQAVVLKRSTSDVERIRHVLPKVVCYDIDRDGLERPFTEFDTVDAVIHTAVCYGRNQESASEILDANTRFPLELMETATRFGCRAFFSTDTYFNKGVDPYNGMVNYSLTKKQFLQWGKEFARAKKIHFVNVRLEHVFGPRDADSKFTTYIIRSCLNNVERLKMTPGDQRRDFIFVTDVASAYAVLLDKLPRQLGSFDEFEVGRGQSTSLRQFVEMTHHMAHATTDLQFGALPHRDGEMMDSAADTEPLVRLGWSPRFSLEDALQKTIYSYSKN